MSISASKKVIGESIAVYEKLLDGLSEGEFVSTPAVGVWSYAEVYAHIFSSTLGSIKAIEVCSKGTAIENSEPLPFSIKLVLFFKRLPPGKYKVPEKIAKDVRKISRTEATELIRLSREKLEAVLPMLVSASPTQKVKHPRLGLLNARQWYAFIHIHLTHHQRQLFRIMAMHKDNAAALN
jgi:hypothetical protein